MKPFEHTVTRLGVGLGVLFLAASLCYGAEPNACSKQKPSPKAKTKAIAKKGDTAGRAEGRLVEITGSRLKYQVKEGGQSTATGLTVTVIDPKSAVNRGYSSPLEVLMRTPSVYRGR